MGTRKEINLEKIAEELGVSVVSVSNALNGRKGVSDKTREKILDKAREFGYSINKKDEQEVTVRKIGVVIADRYVVEFPSFYMDIYRHIVKVADTKHCLTILEVIDVKKETLVDKKTSFLDFNVDGIILIGELEKNYIKWLKEMCNVPFVCVDFYDLDKNFDYFIVDNFRGMSTMTEKLIELGHRDIGFLGNPKATNSIMDRYLGYLKALKNNDIEFNESRLYLDRDKENPRGELKFELPSENLPSAIVCNCDMVAFMLIDKLKEIGLEVPKDISIVSFDNYYYKKTSGIELTTYENDSKTLANLSVNTLMKRIEKNTKPEGIRIIKGRIIKGNSVRDVRGDNEKTRC